MGYRMDTPKGRVQHRHDTAGRDDALQFGLAIGVPNSKLQRWFNEWASKGTSPSPDNTAPPPQPNKAPVATPTTREAIVAPVRRLPKRHKHANLPRVFLNGSPHLRGVILCRGEQQSEVKWDNGNVDIVGNDWYTLIEEKELT